MQARSTLSKEHGVLDFTSALYLGMRHPSKSLRPWESFTTGRPAALESPVEAARVARRLAALQGCQAATLATSTLHASWDLFGTVLGEAVAVFVDAGVYPIGRWGVERAACRGAPIQTFEHYCPTALGRALRHGAMHQPNRRPIILADGFCPACGRPAPVRELVRHARDFDGLVVLDDTQALGILGHSPSARAPYGREGGGILRWSNVRDPHVLLVSSLAKAFGAALAVVAGDEAMIERFETMSQTRVHSSPPSMAAVRAAEHALDCNERFGDRLRARLADRVRQFRRGLSLAGLRAAGGPLPVQTFVPPSGIDALALHGRLLGRGIRSVLLDGGSRIAPRLGLLITAAHRRADVHRAATTLAELTRVAGRSRGSPPIVRRRT
jgi:8-amino-7-oxononanoate synthase